MPWREVSTVEQRREFVALASVEGANRRELCRRFGISAQTGYKWLLRARKEAGDLRDRSRRPHVSPSRSSDAIEALVLAVRDTHPAWSARVPVQSLLDYLEAGDSINEFLEGFPSVTREQVVAFLEDARDRP